MHPVNSKRDGLGEFYIFIKDLKNYPEQFEELLSLKEVYKQI